MNSNENSQTITPYSDEDATGNFVVNQLVHFYTVSMSRVRALMGHSRALFTEEEDHLASDVLRAAVVLLHATIEDFLRSVRGLLLPHCGQDALKDIPLIGQNKNAKLHLGNLAAQRGKSVLELIQDSVNKYLDRRTYNDTKAIENILRKLKVDSSTVRHLYSPIGLLMERRHQIVHRGDERNGELTPISLEQVEQWLTAVEKFVTTIIANINDRVPRVA